METQKVTKITQEELDLLTKLREQYDRIIMGVGQLKVRQFDVEKDITAALVEYTKLQDEERKIIKDLNDKYGAGSLNFNTGEFTPQAQNVSAN